MPRAKIGLISDTHGWLDPRLADTFAGCDRILHAGDIGHPRVIEALDAIAPTSAVKGNIDGGDLRFLPLTLVETFEGRRVGVLHIAGNPRSPNADARKFIREHELDAIVVGHSHIPVVGRVGGCLWINPGAAGKAGFHTQRFAAILWVDQDGTFALDRVELGPRTQT